MSQKDLETTIDGLFNLLITGDRAAAKTCIETARREGISSRELAADVFWPTYERIDRLFRNDQMSVVAHRMATRLLRVLVDQNAAQMHGTRPATHSVLAFCGPSESDEIGAQIAVDLLETEGFRVTFGGGGVPRDEVLAQLHERRPDYLLTFCSAPGDLPAIRQTIDTIRAINASPSTRFVVGGGVFNRAEGLAEEIGADLWANDPIELVMALIDEVSESMTTRRAAAQAAARTSTQASPQRSTRRRAA